MHNLDCRVTVYLLKYRDILKVGLWTKKRLDKASNLIPNSSALKYSAILTT